MKAFTIDVFRLFIWLVILIAVLVPLESLFALHPRKPFRKQTLPDIAFYFLNSLLPKLLLIFPLAIIGWTVHRIVPSVVQAHASALPLWARLAAALVVGEVGFYWGHRWSHQIPFLWRFHSIHHGAQEMDWLISTRAHPLDLVFTRVCGFIPLYALGLARPVTQTLDPVPLLLLVTGTLWGFFIHANLRWRFGPLEWLISTPAFHHWHHTADSPLNRNYASMLPWLDRIFGTFYTPSHWPIRYGMDEPMPQDFTGQLLHPLTSRLNLPRPRSEKPFAST